MNRLNKIILVLVASSVFATNAMAQEVVAATGGTLFSTNGMLALALAIAAAAGGLGQGRALASALDSIGRNPGAASALFVPMILGLVFIESLVIFTFVLCLLLK